MSNIEPRGALARLFGGNPIQEEWFASTFLTHVSVLQVEQIVAGLETSLGKYKDLQSTEERYLVIMERGAVPAKITLNEVGQITQLLFEAPDSDIYSFESAVAGFEALTEKVSLLVLQNGQEWASINPDARLAVGSAFKLAVLAALRDQIESGKRSWRDVTELTPSRKSLPLGILQDWPDYAPLTVHTLASLMISQSDNTATDALIDLVGRDALEEIAPNNRPFLTTREAFVLKDPANEDLLKRYRTGNYDERLVVLRESRPRPLPSPNIFTTGPIALDVEWFFSVRELCLLMGRLADFSILGISTGPANPEDWVAVRFKGGSEPGVLNLTTWLAAKDGKTFCLAATVNAVSSVDQLHVVGLYKGILQALHRSPSNR